MGTTAVGFGCVSVLLTFVVPNVSSQHPAWLVLIPAWGILIVSAFTMGLLALVKADGWVGGAVAILLVAAIMLQFDFANPGSESAEAEAKSSVPQQSADQSPTRDKTETATVFDGFVNRKKEQMTKSESPTTKRESTLPRQLHKRAPTPLEGDWEITELKWSEVNSTRTLMVSKPGLWLSCRGGTMKRIVGTGTGKTLSTYRLEVDSSKKPYTFVRSRLTGTEVEIVERGIFSIDGDKLRICTNKSGPSLPTSFSIVQGRDVKNKYLYTFKRAVHVPATTK